MKRQVGKVKFKFGTIRKAFSLVWHSDKKYPFLLLARSLVEAGFPLCLSWCVSRMVDGLAGGWEGRRIVLALSGAVAVIVICKAASAMLDWRCSSSYMRIQDTFITANSRKAMEMEYASTEDAKVMELYSHAWASNMAAGMILENVFSVIGNGAQLLGCIGIILRLQPFLLAVLAAFVALYNFLNSKMGLRERRCAEETVMDSRGADYARQCMGDPEYAKDVRLYYPGPFFPELLRKCQESRRGKEAGRDVYNGCMQTAQSLLQMLQTSILYLVLAVQFGRGEIQAGYFSLAVSAVTIFMSAVNRISDAWNQNRRNELYLESLDRFRSLPERSGGDAVLEGRVTEVEFRKVSFRYPGREEYALRDVSTVVRFRDILTIVGENGSGKTTFVKLLLGLYRPTEGQIFLNGVDVSRFPDREYRKAFAPVFQDYQIFAYSIRENLVFGEKRADSELMETLRELQMERKVASLPKGLDQCAGKGYEEDGVDFSGGERQKLAIARALLKDSPCLVLDEPTAALDPIAEAELYRKIRGWVEGGSCIFITHRLAGVHFSSRILFFWDGRVAEEGTFEELMAKRGLFHGFYQIQAQFYQEQDVFRRDAETP